MTYFEENGKWFTTDVITNKKFEVNTRSMTVKLKTPSYKMNFNALCERLNIKIENVNILGFYDIILHENTKFYEIFSKLNNSNLFSSIEITTYAKLLSDPGYTNQYYLDNNQNYPDINIGGAWTITTGSPSVIIAVIDEGVDNNNTDIDDNIWTNYGWDYVDQDNIPMPYDTSEKHGTGIAGIITAERDNGLGIAGIAGGTFGETYGCKIMALRVFGYKYDAEEDTIKYFRNSQYIDDAIIYAANHGAKVINMSFALNTLPEFNYVKPSIDNALKYAYNSKGCLLIASSGNVTHNGIYYPASDSLVMAIGGLKKDHTIINYGCYGPELEIVAPAENIFSLLPSDSQNPAKYGLIGTGTSFSAAQVSGLAALILSKYTNWINFDVRKILNESASYLGDTLKFGNGLLDAEEALYYADPDEQEYFAFRPFNISLSVINSHPKIYWERHPDDDSIKYFKIYRADIVNGVYTHFHNIDTANYKNGDSIYSWIDNSVTIVNPRFATSKHLYRVTSIYQDEYDNFKRIKESVTSDEVSTYSNWQNKVSNNNIITYKYSLNNNYPNPFNPSTTIKYSLKEKGFVLLIVYDVLGRIVKELVNKQQSKGNYEVVFDASNLSSGVYYYRIKSGNFVKTKKMILLR